MNPQPSILQFAKVDWSNCWSDGSVVSEQTRKAQQTCSHWQDLVVKQFPRGFTREKPIGNERNAPKIDLVDETNRVAYEFKASKNNVHMEIYRDVFKVLVHNRRNPGQRLTKLVFIAPTAGISMLRQSFTDDVIAITAAMGLDLELFGL
jgi:hypothetical protein